MNKVWCSIFWLLLALNMVCVVNDMVQVSLGHQAQIVTALVNGIGAWVCWKALKKG